MTKATSDYLNREPRTEEQARQEMLANPVWRGIRDDFRIDLQRMADGTYTAPPLPRTGGTCHEN